MKTLAFVFTHKRQRTIILLRDMWAKNARDPPLILVFIQSGFSKSIDGGWRVYTYSILAWLQKFIVFFMVKYILSENITIKLIHLNIRHIHFANWKSHCTKNSWESSMAEDFCTMRDGFINCMLHQIVNGVNYLWEEFVIPSLGFLNNSIMGIGTIWQ